MRMKNPLALPTVGLALLFCFPLGAQSAPSPAIDAKNQSRILNELASRFDEHYWSIAEGKRISAYLRTQAGKNAYQSLTDSQEFARAVTRDLQTFSQDYHLRLKYSADRVTGDDLHTTPPDAPSQAQFARLAVRRNQGFDDVRLLPGNLGYLDVRAFFPATNAGAKLAAAMRLLANTDAMIIDLRFNHGGEPDTADLLLSYLTPTPQLVEISAERVGPNRIESRQRTTPAYVEGERYLDKPVLVLISEQTFSAGEYFAYVIQALGRATLVGDHTHGGVNPYDDYKLDDHFVGSVTYSSPTIVATGSNWTGGVKPDTSVAAAEALTTAQSLALKKLLASGPPESKVEWQSALDNLAKGASSQP